MAAYIAKEVLKQVVIGDMVEGGRCVARVDNLVLFVTQVAPGDVVDIKIVRKKKDYLEAVPIHTYRAGQARVDPICQHFGVCGGCQWQHVSYEAQLAAKERIVLEKLTHIGRLQAPHVAPILAARHTEYYRNKLEFTFSNKRWLSTAEIEGTKQLDRRALGFHKPGSFDRVVDIQKCYLQPPPSDAIRTTLAQFAKEHELSFYDLSQHNGILRNLMIRTTSTGEVMVLVQFGQAAVDKIQQVMHHLQTKFPQLTSLQYVVNEKKNDTFYDLPTHLYHGKPYITEQIDGLKFRIGPKSFFQTNTAQTQVLYRKIRELADPHQNETLYDLYTGVGSIAIFLAQYARHVVGIDITEEAIADARANARLNHVENIAFASGAVEKLLDPQFLSTHGIPHTIIADPPRAGMHPQVIKQLLRMAPKKIVYVSCNPATQARDIALLSEQYQLITSQPIDMFPHTSHVENIALLARKS